MVLEQDGARHLWISCGELSRAWAWGSSWLWSVMVSREQAEAWNLNREMEEGTLWLKANAVNYGIQQQQVTTKYSQETKKNEPHISGDQYGAQSGASAHIRDW